MACFLGGLNNCFMGYSLHLSWLATCWCWSNKMDSHINHEWFSGSALCSAPRIFEVRKRRRWWESVIFRVLYPKHLYTHIYIKFQRFKQQQLSITPTCIHFTSLTLCTRLYSEHGVYQHRLYPIQTNACRVPSLWAPSPSMKELVYFTNILAHLTMDLKHPLTVLYTIDAIICPLSRLKQSVWYHIPMLYLFYSTCKIMFSLRTLSQDGVTKMSSRRRLYWCSSLAQRKF